MLFSSTEPHVFPETEILNKLRCQLLLKGTICLIFTQTAHKSKFIIRCLEKLCQGLGICSWWPNQQTLHSQEFLICLSKLVSGSEAVAILIVIVGSEVYLWPLLNVQLNAWDLHVFQRRAYNGEQSLMKNYSEDCLSSWQAILSDSLCLYC